MEFKKKREASKGVFSTAKKMKRHENFKFKPSEDFVLFVSLQQRAITLFTMFIYVGSI